MARDFGSSTQKNECSLLKKQQENNTPRLQANLSAIDSDEESEFWVLRSVVWMLMSLVSTVMLILGITLDPQSLPALIDHMLFQTKLREDKPDHLHCCPRRKPPWYHRNDIYPTDTLW